MSGLKISGLVMVLDGARTIEKCLESMSFLSERLVLDTGSQDGTQSLARKAGARVQDVSWEGFSRTRNRGLDCLVGDWTLVLDADEWLDSKAAPVIEAAVSSTEERSFSLPRKNLFLGRPMRWGGWGSDWQVRLFRKGEATFDEGRRVHEGAVPKSPAGRIEAWIHHDPYPDLKSYFRKMDSYTHLAALDLRERPWALPLVRLVILPFWVAFRMAFLRLGILDGWRGLLLAGLSGINEAMKDFRALRL